MRWAYEKNITLIPEHLHCVFVCAVSITDRGRWSQRFCPFSGQEGDLIEDFKGTTACLQKTHFWTLSIQVIILCLSAVEEEKGTNAHPQWACSWQQIWKEVKVGGIVRNDYETDSRERRGQWRWQC